MKKFAKILLLISVLTLFITCLVACGETPCKHTYLDNYTCHDRVCTLCGKVSTSSTEHNYETGICACGDVDTNFYTEGLEFKLLGESAYEVVGFIGDDAKVIIPSEYEGLSVTQISDEAFTFGGNIEEISISESITSVSQSCFEPCMSLQRIEVHEENHHYKDIDGNMYDKEGKKLMHYPKGKKEKEFNVPETVTHIERYAFAFCNSLEEVRIPNGVTEIGEGAFYMCTSLQKVDIKANSRLQVIGEEAFRGCPLMSGIFIPNSVNYIEGYAGIESVIYCEAESKQDGWDKDWNIAGFPVVWNCKNCDIADDGFAYKTIDGIRYKIKDGDAHVDSIGLNIHANILPTITYNDAEYSVVGYDGGFSLLTESIYIPTSIENLDNFGHHAGGEFLTMMAVIYCEAKSKPDSWDESWNLNEWPVVWDCKNNDVADDGYIYVTVDGIRYGIKDGVAEVVKQPYYISSANIKSNIKYKGIEYPVITIQKNAFASRHQLTNVTIPDSVINNANGGYASFTTIYCEAETQPSGWDSSWNSSNCPVVWDCKNNDVADDGYIYVTVDGVKYGIKDGVATVVMQTSSVETVNIPTKITYKGQKFAVTRIEDQAFSILSNYLTNLTSIAIPKSITEIGDLAFFGDYKLVNIKVSNANEVYKSEDGNLYTKDGRTLIQYALGNNDEIFEIPSGVEIIGDGAFALSFTLETVKIPESVTSIGMSAFMQADRLEYLVIPINVQSIKPQAFNNLYCPIYFEIDSAPSEWSEAGILSWKSCWGYKYTEVDGFMYGIKDGEATVVNQYKDIKTANIPEKINHNGSEYKVVGIEERAFDGCRSLKTVTIPASVTQMNAEFFRYCRANVSISSDNLIYKVVDQNIYSKDGKTLIRYQGGENFVVPENVESIYSYAFSGSGIEEITIPNSVISIGEGAFQECHWLTIYCEATSKPSGWSEYWNISYRPVIWHKHNFSNDYACIDRTCLSCGDIVGATSPHDYEDDFACCDRACIICGEVEKATKDHTFDADYTCIDKTCNECGDTFIATTVHEYIDNVCACGREFYTEGLEFIIESDGTAYVRKYTGTATTCVIPSKYNGKNVTKVFNGAFNNCTSLTSITIPDSVTSIGYLAFKGCTLLETVTFGENSQLTSIGDHAFDGCSSLTSITIPDSVTSIDRNAFYGCSMLASITIPSSVTSIGDSAFHGCSSLEKVNYLGNIDQWVEIKFTAAFGMASSSNPLYYANNLYINDVLVEDAVLTSATKISSYAFSNCTSLTSITIPDSVTSIGNYAFYGCDSLIIYSEADSQPSGWSKYWNYSDCPVVWGYEE